MRKSMVESQQDTAATIARNQNNQISPTRQRAVQFLDVSPENPFSHVDSQINQSQQILEPDDYLTTPFEANFASQNTQNYQNFNQNEGQGLGPHSEFISPQNNQRLSQPQKSHESPFAALRALNNANMGAARIANLQQVSPESGKKASLYQQLQDEIRKEASANSALNQNASSFMQTLGGLQKPSTKNYTFAEKAKSGSLLTIGAKSPEKGRPIRQRNPFDCFRNGEDRSQIVKNSILDNALDQIEQIREAQKLKEQQNLAQKRLNLANIDSHETQNSNQQRSRTKSPLNSSQQQNSVRIFKPQQEQRIQHALPNNLDENNLFGHENREMRDQNSRRFDQEKPTKIYDQQSLRPQQQIRASSHNNLVNRQQTFGAVDLSAIHSPPNNSQDDIQWTSFQQNQRSQPQPDPAQNMVNDKKNAFSSQMTENQPQRQNFVQSNTKNPFQGQNQPIQRRQTSPDKMRTFEGAENVGNENKLLGIIQKKYAKEVQEHHSQHQQDTNYLKYTTTSNLKQTTTCTTTTIEQQLAYVNPNIVRQFGLKSVESIKSQLQSKVNMDQLSLSLQLAGQLQNVFGHQPTQQESIMAARLFNSALLIQRIARGYRVRKHFVRQAKILHFFRKAEKVMLVRQLVYALRNSYYIEQNSRQRQLKSFINGSATKIQSLFRGVYARKYIRPLKLTLGPNLRSLEGAACGWRTRRILKSKEISGRIRQIRDFEQALSEASQDAKSASYAEKIGIQRLIRGFKSSKLDTIAKMVQLLHKMESEGLWITYIKAEEAESHLRTPRKYDLSPENISAIEDKNQNSTSKNSSKIQKDDNMLVIPSRTNNLPTVNFTRSSPVSLDKKSVNSPIANHQNTFATLNSKSPLKFSTNQLEMTSVPENRRPRRESELHQNSSNRISRVPFPEADRKFSIAHNNLVTPNFQSTSYQSEARNKLRARMDYNPRESAAKNRQNNLNRTSEYSQQNQTAAINRSYDNLNLSGNFLNPHNTNTIHSSPKATPMAIKNFKNEQLSRSRSKPRHWENQEPVAKSQYVLDGEVFTLQRFSDRKQVDHLSSKISPAKQRDILGEQASSMKAKLIDSMKKSTEKILNQSSDLKESKKSECEEISQKPSIFESKLHSSTNFSKMTKETAMSSNLRLSNSLLRQKPLKFEDFTEKNAFSPTKVDLKIAESIKQESSLTKSPSPHDIFSQRNLTKLDENKVQQNSPQPQYMTLNVQACEPEDSERFNSSKKDQIRPDDLPQESPIEKQQVQEQEEVQHDKQEKSVKQDNPIEESAALRFSRTLLAAENRAKTESESRQVHAKITQSSSGPFETRIEAKKCSLLTMNQEENPYMIKKKEPVEMSINHDRKSTATFGDGNQKQQTEMQSDSSSHAGQQNTSFGGVSGSGIQTYQAKKNRRNRDERSEPKKPVDVDPSIQIFFSQQTRENPKPHKSRSQTPEEPQIMQQSTIRLRQDLSPLMERIQAAEEIMVASHKMQQQRPSTACKVIKKGKKKSLASAVQKITDRLSTTPQNANKSAATNIQKGSSLTGGKVQKTLKAPCKESQMAPSKSKPKSKKSGLKSKKKKVE